MTTLNKVLLIGINYIGTEAELRGCINDVFNIRTYLEAKNLIKEGETQVKTLLEVSDFAENRPTKANILAGLRWLVEGATKDSKLFLHYSGHGSYVRDQSGDESDRRDETLCPLDYARSGVIIDDQLRATLVDPLPAGAKLWALFDCCNSGTALDLRFNYQVNYRQSGGGKEYVISTEPKQKKSTGEVYLFSGCLDTQTSADSWEEGQAQGAMTYGFLNTLREFDVKGKEPSYKGMMKGILSLIKQKKYTQTPHLSTGHFCDLTGIMWQ